MGNGLREAIDHVGSLALDEVECFATVGRRGADERRAGGQGTDDVVREAADPKQRRIREQLHPRGERAGPQVGNQQVSRRERLSAGGA